LPVGTNKGHLHYYYTESENDPANDPLTIWMNGGPGASSIAYGMMTETGQLVFNRDSMSANSTVPALQYNRFGWSRFSNMLYFESPAGVGFSYCEETPCTSNDTSTALDSYDALVGFFERFPALKKRPLYITGESYAGIYCPMLAEQIMNRNTDGSINLQGLMVSRTEENLRIYAPRRILCM
jgi:carboxypeptidase C (cathepsin A)